MTILLLFSLHFFFSSRRRHTRLQGDWSSDVCSSDLGDVDSNAPLFSAVLTSPGEHAQSRLWLYEIQALKLRAALVVLSACQTGKGRVRGGDEVAGFTRTLLLAGADTVVASLWDVSDKSTAELMEGFYRSLRAGQPAAVAIRD